MYIRSINDLMFINGKNFDFNRCQPITFTIR